MPARAWTVAAALFAVIFSGGCSTYPAMASEPHEEQYQVLYFQVQMALSQRDYAWVIENVEPLRGRDDTPPELLLALGEAYLAERDWDESVEVTSEILDNYREFVPALSRRAELYRRRRMNDEAIADLERALEIVPNNIAILESLGLMRLRSVQSWEGDLAGDEHIHGLLRVYDRLLELKQGREKVLPLIVLSSVYGQMDEHEKAIDYGKRAAELSPQDLRAQLALAEAYESADRMTEALNTYGQALLIEPENEIVRAKIVQIIEDEQVEGGARQFYGRLAENFPGMIGIQRLYGNTLLEEKDWSAAVEHFERLVEMRPDDATLKTSLVRALLLSQQEDAALILIEQMLANEDASVADLLELTQVVREEGDLELVIRMLEQVRASGHDDVRVPLALAQVQADAGMNAEAMTTLEGLLEQEPGNYAAVTTLADLYAGEERYQEALELYEGLDAATRAQRDNEIRLRKSELYRRSGQYDMAVAVLDEVLNEGGELAALALQMIIDIHTQAGDSQKAQEAVDQYIASSGEEEQRIGRSLKAWLYVENRQYEEAIEILETLHAENPEDFGTIQLLAESYAEVGAFDKAEGLLNASATLNGGEPTDSHLLLSARLYRMQDKPQQAAQVMEQLLRRNKDNEAYLLVAGEYYYEAGNLEKAEQALRRAIELSPETAEPYNALGYFFAEAGIKLDEAQTLVNKALELSPDQGHIIDSLGWVYYQQGRYAEALEKLQQAERLMQDSPDAVIYDHLGDAYEKLGRLDEAAAAWRRALELDPDIEGVQEKLDKVLLKQNS